MGTFDENDVDAQEIPLDQLGEIAGGIRPPSGRSPKDRPIAPSQDRSVQRPQ